MGLPNKGYKKEIRDYSPWYKGLISAQITSNLKEYFVLQISCQMFSEQQYYNFIQKLIKDIKTPGHRMVAGDLNLMKRFEVEKNRTIV